jgi:hypothetical protein
MKIHSEVGKRLLGLAFLIGLVGQGCGNSSSNLDVVPLSGASGPATRTLTLIHDTVQEAGPSSGLGPHHAALRVGFVDAGGALIGSPQTVNKSVLGQAIDTGIPPRADVQVPPGAQRVQIDYLGQDGEKTGDTSVPLPPGDTLQLLGNSAAPVHFAQSGGAFQLIVNDKAMLVKGVGFDYSLGVDTSTPGDTQWFSYIDPDIAKAGANAIRTYGVGWNFKSPQEQAQIISAMLAYAAANSTADKPLMVLAGLVFEPGQGDMSALIPQTVALVQNDPNYGNLLGWVIGNENPVDQYPQIDAVIKAVKAGMTSDDKVRPVTHAVPTVSAGQVAIIQQQLPSLDWLGINTFYGQFDAAHQGGGFLNIQAASLSQGGWAKPWLLTEYYSYDLPSPGFGNVAGMPSQSLNGQPYYLELNSTLNAANYRRSYQDYIVSADALAKGSVGGMALNWGPPHNSKLIAFWKTMYAYRGEFKPFVNPPYSLAGFDRLECAFVVADMYGGSLGANRPPQIVLPSDGDPQGIEADFKASLEKNPPAVARGAQLTASVTASDSDPLTFDWYLVGGTAEGFSGNIDGAQKDPANYINTTTLRLGGGTSSSVAGGTRNTITFQALLQAAAGNNYQLRVVARDGQGGAATACVAFPMQ